MARHIPTLFGNEAQNFILEAERVEDERLEAKYVGVGVGRLPLHTRLMYFDLLNIEIVEE